MKDREQRFEKAAEFVDPTKPIEGLEEFDRKDMYEAKTAVKKLQAGDAILLERRGEATMGVIRDFVFTPKNSKTPERSKRIYKQIEELKREKENLENLLLNGSSLDERAKRDTRWRLEQVNKSLENYNADIELLGIYINKYGPEQGEPGKRKFVNANPKDFYQGRVFISQKELEESRLKNIPNFKTRFTENDIYADAQHDNPYSEPKEPDENYLGKNIISKE